MTEYDWNNDEWENDFNSDWDYTTDSTEYYEDSTSGSWTDEEWTTQYDETYAW
jgi:hypothetical protein